MQGVTDLLVCESLMQRFPKVSSIIYRVSTEYIAPVVWITPRNNKKLSVKIQQELLSKNVKIKSEGHETRLNINKYGSPSGVPNGM